ncbi:MAG TPA: vWA domain-containing protein [Polyangia bacterium]
MPGSRSLHLLFGVAAVAFLVGCTAVGAGGPSGAAEASAGGASGASSGASSGTSSGASGSSPLGGRGAFDAGTSEAAPAPGLSADGPNCGLTRFAVEGLPPSALIVLDKSTSMNDFAMGLLACLFGKCNSKWTDMTNALTSTVTATQGTIDWGIKFFPSDDSCGVDDSVAAPVAPNNAMVVNAAIAANKPSGATPTRLAIESAGRYLMDLTTPNPRYVVLATDGLPNCNGPQSDADDAATITAVTNLAAAGIPVFVIGVGTLGNGDATLSAMAKAGGKPRAADPAYYPVTTSADLSAALAVIGGQIVSCTLPIKDPPDPTNIAVEADGARVPQSATEGWDYGPGGTTIELSGTWCTNYQNGMIKNVQTIFGCPGVIIP